MYYSESLSSPVTEGYIKSQYGINPDADPANAALIGIYPLTEAPADTTPARYEKRGDHYEAIPLPITNAELAMVEILRKHKVSHEQLKAAVIPQWSADVTYAAGDEVQHQGKVYRKLDDGDTSAPDDVAGGWADA